MVVVARSVCVFAKLFLFGVRALCFFLLYFLRTSSVGGLRCQTSSFFPVVCSVDHERDWPPSSRRVE